MHIIGGSPDRRARARLDVRTGALRWIFHLIPRPGEFGSRHLAGRRLNERRRVELVRPVAR